MGELLRNAHFGCFAPSQRREEVDTAELLENVPMFVIARKSARIFVAIQRINLVIAKPFRAVAIHNEY